MKKELLQEITVTLGRLEGRINNIELDLALALELLKNELDREDRGTSSYRQDA